MSFCNMWSSHVWITLSHQSTSKTKRRDLREGFPVPNTMFLLPKQPAAFLWDLHTSFLPIWNLSPVFIWFMFWDKRGTYSRGPPVETTCQYGSFFCTRTPHLEPLLCVSKHMCWVAQVFLYRVILTCFLKMVFQSYQWKSASGRKHGITNCTDLLFQLLPAVSSWGVSEKLMWVCKSWG